jgi:hypothetical protein
MEIKISKSAHTCMGCHREFVHEEPVNSLVRWVDNALQREDYCADCGTPERFSGAWSVWTPNYYDPQVAEQQPAEVFSPLRQLFYEAVESEDRIECAKAFLAAQLLRRQKVFRQIKESDEAEGEARVFLFADRLGNRLIEVRDPSFTYLEMESARKSLLDRLRELETPQTTEEQAKHDEEQQNSHGE